MLNFENEITGVINRSIHQLSGRYKILVSSRNNDYELFLSDYYGHKVPLEIGMPFLPQVSSFLRNGRDVVEKYIDYGGYQRNAIKYWHIPLHLSNKDFPEYFIISKLDNILDDGNSPSLNAQQLYKKSNTLDVINLETIYLTNIFNEITTQETINNIPLDHPVQLWWDGIQEDPYLILYGWNIYDNHVVKVQLNIGDIVRNRDKSRISDFEFFNEYILRQFEENNLIYPKFLNLEFEFDYEREAADIVDFQNFHGFLAYKTDIELFDITRLSSDAKTLQLYEPKKSNHIIFNDISLIFPNVPKTYEEIYNPIQVQEVNQQPEIYDLLVTRISLNNIFRFFYEGEQNPYFEYVVQPSDIYPSLWETCLWLFRKFERLSNGTIICVPRLNANNIVQLEFTFEDKTIVRFFNGLHIDNTFRNPYKQQDDPTYFESESIGRNDILVVNNTNFLTTDYLSINNVVYNVLRSFNYRGRNILRLSSDPRLTSLTDAFFIAFYQDTFAEFKPIPYLKYNGRYVINSQLFDISGFESMYNKFNNIVIQPWLPPLSGFKPGPMLQTNQSKQNLLNIYKTSPLSQHDFQYGLMFTKTQNCFIDNHILNYDSSFGVYNDCVSFDLRFAFFLIKGNCPNHYLNTTNEYRYFKDKPKVYSKTYKVNNTICETVFLGCKYQFPIAYNEYDVSVYLDTEASITAQIPSNDFPYYCIVSHTEKYIHIVINHFLNFKSLFSDSDKNFYLDLAILYNSLNLLNYNAQTHNSTEFVNSIGFKFGDRISQQDFAVIQATPTTGNSTVDYSTIKSPLIYKNNDLSKFVVFRHDTSLDTFDTIFKENDNTEQYFNFIIKVSDSTPQGYSNHILNLFKLTFKNITDINTNFMLVDDIVIQMHPEEFQILLQEPDIFERILDVEDTGGFLTFLVENTSKELWQKYIHNYISITPTPPSDTVTYSYPQQIFIYLYNLITNSIVQDIDFFNNSVSLRDQYYELVYKAYPPNSISVNFFNPISGPHFNHQGFYNPTLPLQTFEELSNPHYISPSTYDSQFQTILDNLITQYKFTIFDNSQFWFIISGCSQFCKTYRLSQISLEAYISLFDIFSLTNFLGQNLLHIYGPDGKPLNDTVKVLGLFPPKNFNGQELIRRYSTFFNLKLDEYQYITQFQDGIAFSLYSLFYNNFGKLSADVDAIFWSDFFNVTGTNLWEEYNSRLISSLFIGKDEIVLNTSITQGLQDISIFELLRKNINTNQLIIVNDNSNFLSKFTGNVITYIRDNYTKYLLDNHYTVSQMIINDKTIEFSYNYNDYLINLNNFTSFNTVKIILTRK